MEKTVKRKVVLVVGGTADLGQGCAANLLERGVHLGYMGCGDAQERATVCEALKKKGNARFIDLSREMRSTGDIQAALEHLYDRFGTVDAVVNLYAPSATSDANSIRVHLQTLESDTVVAAEFMAAHKTQGVVVNQYIESGVYADSPLAYAAAAAKGAVIGLVRTACVRFGKAGVRVVGVLAGLLDLPGVKAQASERVLNAKTPLGRWISVEDVAATINFLALDSGYITGQVLLVDGGLLSGVNGI